MPGSRGVFGVVSDHGGVNERRLVIVGASLAGLRAVEAARRAGYDGRIVLIGAEVHPPYDRPPLSKSFLGADGERGAGVVAEFRSAAVLRDELDVDLRLGVRASGLDADARVVRLEDGTSVEYDALVIATGATPRWLPATDPEGPDGPLSGVSQLRTVEGARRIRAALDARERIVVIGAGFIGSEVASAARRRGLPLTLVEALAVPLTRSVGAQVGSACARLHEANGTDLRLGTSVVGLQEETVGGIRRLRGVRLDDGTTVAADLVVLGIGVRPATDWLEGSGIALHPGDRGVLVDATLATNLPDVYAAGDVAHVENPLFDSESQRLEHWTNAADHGAAAGRHAVDPSAVAPIETVPYFWSDLYAHRLQFVGTAAAEEVQVVVDDLATGGGFIALYRRDDRLVGAFVVDLPRFVMKLRRRVIDRAPFADAVDFAATARRESA